MAEIVNNGCIIMVTEEGRNKIQSCLLAKEAVWHVDPLPFPCLSLDSSLGMKPACRIDRPAQGSSV